MSIEHDGATSLSVRFLSGLMGARPDGWFVVRTCPCHSGQTITAAFENREAAERALRVLDEDARRYA